MSPTEVVILFLGVACSVAGVIVVRRIVPQEKLTENNDYAGFTYGILGLIYGIYLAFTVVVVWQQFEDAADSRAHAQDENQHLNRVQVHPHLTRSS